jgi:preprotein translocase subunit SecF
MFDLIKYKKLFIGFSITLVLASIILIAVFGFRLGIDFSGGTLWQIKFGDKAVVSAELADALKVLGKEGVNVTADETNNSLLIRALEMPEEEHQKLRAELVGRFGTLEELRFESIGPTIGQELRNKAIKAFLLVLLGISLYIAFAFRKVSYPVSSWKYGFITLITLFHDALIPAGFYALAGQLYGVEADTNFIVALLVIMGFSVHDTIVVFDRIRENLLVQKGKSLEEVINLSVNQTLARSINTSFTLILVLIALLVFGASSLAWFTGLILLGTIIGTYSSIFVASPLLTYFVKNN